MRENRFSFLCFHTTTYRSATMLVLSRAQEKHHPIHRLETTLFPAFEGRGNQLHKLLQISGLRHGFILAVSRRATGRFRKRQTEKNRLRFFYPSADIADFCSPHQTILDPFPLPVS
jgi:hypothetical protein